VTAEMLPWAPSQTAVMMKIATATGWNTARRSSLVQPRNPHRIARVAFGY